LELLQQGVNILGNWATLKLLLDVFAHSKGFAVTNGFENQLLKDILVDVLADLSQHSFLTFSRFGVFSRLDHLVHFGLQGLLVAAAHPLAFENFLSLFSLLSFCHLLGFLWFLRFILGCRSD
jgi:hypothetical protein